MIGRSRRSVQRLDRLALGEATRLFAISANVAGRLERSTGLVAEVLSHPPQALAYHCDGYGDFVLSASRLDRAKRIDLLLEAAATDESCASWSSATGRTEHGSSSWPATAG